MQFGDYTCFTIDLDRFRLDGGAMFGVVPKPLWEQKVPPDEKNRIPMAARSLIIKGRNKLILVDTGLGDKLPEKFQKIYGIDNPNRSMAERLAPWNIRPEDITDVIITHLHFDHAGGNTLIENGQVRPTFPNATYHLQKCQWDFAQTPSVRDQASYIPDNFMPLSDNHQLNIINGPTNDLFDGIELLVTDGHTDGQQHPLILGEKTALFVCADLIPTAAHLPLTWHMAYDNHPISLISEKAEILNRAVNNGWILCFEHDPEIAAATIKRSGDRVVMDQAVTL